MSYWDILTCHRFSYIAICCVSILRRLDSINVQKAVDYIVSCKNIDGGFGCTPGGESHAGQSVWRLLKFSEIFCLKFAISWSWWSQGLLLFNVVFCCVAALAITGSLHHVDKDLLGWWLCERQVKSGGLNGRPEKLPDVGCFPFLDMCYSIWILMTL